MRDGGEWSPSIPVYGGVPQGSILGVLFFNITTDDLEDQLEEDREGMDWKDEGEEVVSEAAGLQFYPGKG